jgi:ribosome-associated heat shock protein Hsp15
MLSVSVMSSSEPQAELRLDRWLWCTRFFKTRSAAADAVRGGHVRINGNRVKPSRAVSVGDELVIAKGIYDFVVTVNAVPLRRGPAIEAAQCFTETDASRAAREQRTAERRAVGAALEAPTVGRPDKRTRRLIRDRGRTL